MKSWQNISILGCLIALPVECRPEEGHISCQLQRISMRCCYLNFLIKFFISSYCKKPLTSNCTIQIVTPGKGKKSTPKPIPILAAGFCSDKMSLLLVYGTWFQPTIERVVRRCYSGVKQYSINMSMDKNDFKIIHWSTYWNN